MSKIFLTVDYTPASNINIDKLKQRLLGPFRIYQLFNTANQVQFHSIRVGLSVLISWYSRRTQQAQAQWAKNWEFVPKDHVCLKLFLSNNDGFRGEWFKVSSSDGSFLQCTIDGWIDGDNNVPNESNVPKYRDFSCSSLSK